MNVLAVPLELIVDSFEAEYADCGSHQIRLKVMIAPEELEELTKSLTEE